MTWIEERRETLPEGAKLTLWNDQADEFKSPIVTQLGTLETFFPAEGYHQNYYRTNPAQPYCMAVVAPKVQKFREKFADRVVGD